MNISDETLDAAYQKFGERRWDDETVRRLVTFIVETELDGMRAHPLLTYVDGEIVEVMTEREWFEKYDEPTRIQKSADATFEHTDDKSDEGLVSIISRREHPNPDAVLAEFGLDGTDEMGVVLGDDE